MTQFSSIHPYDIGHYNRTNIGVRPALCACGRVCLSMVGHWGEVQTNAPSPILMDVRDALQLNGRQIDWGFVLARFENWIEGGGAYVTLDYERITDADVIRHARKVLRLLASLDMLTVRV